MSSRRAYRVAEKLREILAKKLLQFSDPRFYLVSITAAQISADLRDAKVYWTVTGGSARKSEVTEAFRTARGYISSNVAKDLGLKYAPKIMFFYDNTLDVLEEVDQLLNNARIDLSDSINSSEEE